jgi:hypothetical protein
MATDALPGWLALANDDVLADGAGGGGGAAAAGARAIAARRPPIPTLRR